MRLRAHANRAACAALAIERLLYAVNCLRSESRANVSHGSKVPVGRMEKLPFTVA